MNVKKVGLPPAASALTRRTLLAGAGAVGLMGLTQAAGAQAVGSDRLVVYSTTFPVIQRRLAEAFKAKTGIEVQSLRLATGPLAQRFLAEQQSGQHLCDVITLGHDIFFNQISEAGLLAEIDDVPAVARLSPAWRPGKRFTTILIAPHSIGYNTTQVAGASIPTGWHDVLKPEFAGQIIFADPRANEPILLFLATLRQRLGDDYIRRLGQQKLRFVPAIPQAVEQIIAGEAKLYMPALAMNLVQYQGTGASVAIISTPSPTNGTYFFSGIAAHAPNPAGAREWYEFVLSPEGQEILCRDNGVSPLGDIPGSIKAPENFVHLDLRDIRGTAGELYDLLGLAA